MNFSCGSPPDPSWPPPAGCINHWQKQVRGSSTRDKLIIRFAVIDCYTQTDRNSDRKCNDHACAKKLNIHGWTVTRGERDTNVFERGVKGQSQYVVASFCSLIGSTLWDICGIFVRVAGDFKQVITDWWKGCVEKHIEKKKRWSINTNSAFMIKCNTNTKQDD